MTNSRDVARFVGKAHRHVLRDIDRIIAHSPDLGGVWFQEVKVPHPTIKGRMDRASDMTRDGAVLVISGYTGPNAIDFKLAYIRRFNEMEVELEAEAATGARQIPDPAIPHVDGRYLVHVVGGRVNLVTDVRDACIVNGSNPVNVMTFLREYLDPAVFPVALETIAYRASVCLRHGPKGAPVPSILRAPEPSHEARVLSIIRAAGRISRTDLLMKMKHHLRAAELDRVLMALERSGRIRVDTPSPPVGRPPFWYAAA